MFDENKKKKDHQIDQDQKGGEATYEDSEIGSMGSDTDDTDGAEKSDSKY